MYGPRVLPHPSKIHKLNRSKPEQGATVCSDHHPQKPLIGTADVLEA
jgi:hypothetical protein